MAEYKIIGEEKDTSKLNTTIEDKVEGFRLRDLDGKMKSIDVVARKD